MSTTTDPEIFPPLPAPADLIAEVRRIAAAQPDHIGGRQAYVDIDENVTPAEVVGPCCLIGAALLGLGWRPADWRSFYGDLDEWTAENDDDEVAPEINYEEISTLYLAQGWPATTLEMQWLVRAQTLNDSVMTFAWGVIPGDVDAFIGPRLDA